VAEDPEAEAYLVECVTYTGGRQHTAPTYCLHRQRPQPQTAWPVPCTAALCTSWNDRGRAAARPPPLAARMLETMLTSGETAK
jgi:hypothetical protein